MPMLDHGITMRQEEIVLWNNSYSSFDCFPSLAAGSGAIATV
jgi:hypothetical protein